MPESSTSADPAREDTELAAALDSFVARARQESGAAPLFGLPPLRLSEGLEPGTVLGDYELVRRIGVGGMGVVFEARQKNVLDRRVALKVLRNAFETEELSLRFKREVAAVAELDHPGIVPIVDARVDGGTPYYVMKYVAGLSAAALVRELRGSSRPPVETAPVQRFIERSVAGPAGGGEPPSSAEGIESSWEEPYVRWVARIGLQVAEALQYAHEHGFVHRDVKPGNVILTTRGRAVLLDFGLVAAAGDEGLTRPGEFVGTLAYASPEQVRGERLDGRTDVYSLGSTLYELLSLRRPFGDCAHNELLRRLEHDDPPPLGKEVPADLRTIVSCALARSPGRRFATAGALAGDLRAFLAGQPIRARPASPVERAVHAVRRHPRLCAVLAGVLLAVGGLRGLAHRRAGERVAFGAARLEACLLEQAELGRLVEDHQALLDRRPRDNVQPQELRASIQAARVRVATGYREARSLFEQAFEHVAGHGGARAELARLAAEELRQALRDHRDVLAPAELGELESALERHDDDGRFARLRDPGGWVSLASEPSGARVTIFADGAAVPRFVLETPIDRLELGEGSYLALVEAEGRAATRLPFLVRRAAAYDEAGARPARELRVEPLRPEEIPAGFVHVPAGETLVADDPPRWELVPSFLMQAHEVTWGELQAWFEARAGRVEAELELPEDLPLVRTEGGTWELRGAAPGLPVHGCAPMVMSAWTDWLDGRLPRAPADWVPSLPTAAEYVRATRGADGRPYPWGREFDWERCANYLSGPAFEKDAEPVPAGSHAGDVSPFGVFDLAGSVAEVTCDLHEPRPGEYVVCGGSSWSADPAELAVTARRECKNDVPRRDVGFRVVLRPLPDWARLLQGAPRPFAEDFERRDSPEVGNGWIELAGVPLGLRVNPNEPERCSIAGGRLVCQGGEGNFSEPSGAWHAIHVPASGWTARAEIRATCSHPDEAGGRRFGILLARGFRPSEKELWSLTLGFDGEGVLQWSSPGGAALVRSVGGLDASTLLAFELSAKERRLEGRIWPVGRERPASPTMEAELPQDGGTPGFIGFEAKNLVGVVVEADWVAVSGE